MKWAGLDLWRLLPVILISITASGGATVAWNCLALNGHQWIVTRLVLRLRTLWLPERSPAECSEL
jgi:hypothetical protein